MIVLSQFCANMDVKCAQMNISCISHVFIVLMVTELCANMDVEVYDLVCDLVT